MTVSPPEVVTAPVVTVRSATVPAPSPTATELAVSVFAATDTVPSLRVNPLVVTLPPRVIVPPLTSVVPKGPEPDQPPVPVNSSVPEPAV